jgi:asparagine synthetase B (glutamine-hydrolysing)
MYYYARGTELFVAPSIHALLKAGVPAQLNDEALAVMLRLGFLVGEDTVFEGIHVLPPHGRLRWTAGMLDVTGQLVAVSPSSLSRTAAIDEYMERFKSAVARRHTSGVSTVPLSGGHDSRHIFLELWARAGRGGNY